VVGELQPEVGIMKSAKTLRALSGCGALLCALAAVAMTACTNVGDQAKQGEVARPTVAPPVDTPRQQPAPAVTPETPEPGQSTGTPPAAPQPAPAAGSGDPSPAIAGSSADPGADPAAPTSPGTGDPRMPPNAEKIAGIEFFHRIVGKWTGNNNASRPTPITFPMTVDMVAVGESLIFGEYEVDAQNNVLWGFNIETYDGEDVLSYRNGGYLLGLLRDTRAKLVEHDEARGYYRFCAVKEHGGPVDGCNYVDARYTFVSDDEMIFEVTTRSGQPHVRWEARRVEKHELPTPFPATIASQGQGEAPWPAESGVSGSQ
jgi:hypothetical protein